MSKIPERARQVFFLVASALRWAWNELWAALPREDPATIRIFDRSTLFLLIVTGLWYGVSYLNSSDVPSLDPHGAPGWWTWYDQGQYLKTTTELAHGELRPSVYWLGYPLLGAPFDWVMPRHPYFIPNLIMVVVLVGAFFLTCRHFMGRVEAWILVAVFIFFGDILRDKCLIIPWNTLPAYTAIYLSVYLLLITRPTLRGFVICASATGIALFSRPNEILPLTALYLFGLLRLEGRRRLWAFLAFGVVLAVVGLATISINLYFYGHISSPYMGTESRKFGTANFGIKFYQLFCDGAFLTGNAVLPPGTRTTQILERFPYFLFLLPGTIALVQMRGLPACGLFLAIMATVGFYMTYSLVDNPPYFWTYGSYHYIWWIIPWLGFLSYLSFRQAPWLLPRKIYIAALLVPVAVYLVVGFKAVEVQSSDAKENPLAVSTGYHDQTFSVNLTPASAPGVIEDVRLHFSKPPPYAGTYADTGAKVILDINGARKGGDSGDYCISGVGPDFDFSFLGKGLHLKQGDLIHIEFAQTPEPFLARASLLQVRFAPGRGVARFFTP
jgi:hypothetical protein